MQGMKILPTKKKKYLRMMDLAHKVYALVLGLFYFLCINCTFSFIHVLCIDAQWEIQLIHIIDIQLYSIYPTSILAII